MIQDFAKTRVSMRRVPQSLQRNSAHLTSKWNVGIARDRVKADNEHSCRHYFEPLHSKTQQHEVDARHIYNLDEKGLLTGITSRQKRVFSRQLWGKKKERQQACKVSKESGQQFGNGLCRWELV